MSNDFDVPVVYSLEEPVIPSSSLIGGTRIQNRTTGQGLTLGACGFYNGDDAFVTCGHGSSGIGNIFELQSSNTTIGNIVEHQYSNNGYGDFAIVKITNTSMSTTNIVGNPSNENEQFNITTSITRPAYGTLVSKYGKNGGYAYGTVTNSNVSSVSMATDGVNGPLTIKGQVHFGLTYGSSINGDSGGPIFTTSGSFCGVVSTAGSSSFYFTPYQYIRNAGFNVRVG